jgi:ABC-type lipoprotein export system ATPase subunit
MTALTARGLTSRAATRDGRPVVVDADIAALPGSLTAIIGPSGAGKSTLLDILTTVEVPAAGTVWFGDAIVNPASQRVRARLRARSLATARQTDDLIDAMTAEENIALGQRLARRPDRESVDELSAALGLVPALRRTLVADLSGGERRRVAVARALATGSPVVCCDEPTAGLDEVAATAVRDLLGRAAAGGRTVVVVTHDPALARRSDRLVTVEHGRVVGRVDGPDRELIDRAMGLL